MGEMEEFSLSQFFAEIMPDDRNDRFGFWRKIRIMLRKGQVLKP